MADYSMQEPFNIDDGSLDDVSPQQCFVLGYEFSSITMLCDMYIADTLTLPPEPFIINIGNVARLTKALNNRGIKHKWSTCDDPEENWMFLYFIGDGF